MIISVKNKQIKTYVDDSNIQHDKNVVMENASINFANNRTFLMLNNTALSITNFAVSVSGSDFKVAYRNGTQSDFIEATSVTDTQVKIADSGGKQIRKWNIFLIKDTEGTYTTEMTVSYTIGTTNFSYKFNVTCSVVGIAEKYIILAQNFKFTITDDYYRAFKDSEHKASGSDERLLNEKRKEFLLNYFDLQGQVGTYHTLLAALHYFGYGDLLEIRELWKNQEGKRQSTKITNQIQEFIDNRLLGFKKTNQLQLVYQINKEDGTTDSDGFPNYVSVLFDTEEMLIKMYALKRVMEKDFLPLNTKIVDIIGEHTSTLGVDAKVWLNDQRIDDIDLNPQNDGGFKFDFDQRQIEIHEHEVLLKNKHFIATTSGTHTGNYPSGTTESKLTDTIYFEVDKELNYDLSTTDTYNDLFNDNDFVERYDRSDFGLVNITIDADQNLYSRWKFEIYDTTVSQSTPQYTSPLYNISDLPTDKKIHFGVRKVGTFKVMAYLFDYYGGVTLMNPNNNTFTVIKGNLDFKLARIDRTNKGFGRGLDFWSTYPTLSTVANERVVEIDCFDATLNVNTFNESTHTNTVLRYQAEKYDLRTLQMNTFQFNNVPLTELNNTVLTDYGYEYARYVIDVVGNGTNASRDLKMRLFEHDSWDVISLAYNSTTYPTKEEYLHALITLINNKPSTSVWSRFTATLQTFSPDTIANAVPVIRLVAKEVGETVGGIYTDFTSVNAYAPKVNHAEDYYTLMPLSGYMRIHPKLSATASDLKVNGVTVSNIAINAIGTLETALKNHFTANNIKASVFAYTNYLVVTSRVDLTIEHGTFGKVMDVVRGKESTILKMTPSGDTFYRGEPFYAYIDIGTRVDGNDFEWTLKDALTGAIINKQKSYVYRNMMFNSGSYTLELKSTDAFGTNTKIKSGFVIVQ